MQQENSGAHSTRRSWTDRHPIGRFVLCSFGLSLVLGLLMVFVLIVFCCLLFGSETGHRMISQLPRQCLALSGNVVVIRFFMDLSMRASGNVVFICFFAGLIMRAIGYINPQWETLKGWSRNFICAFVAGAASFLLQSLYYANEYNLNYFFVVSASLIGGVVSAILGMYFGPLIGLDKLGMKSIPGSGSES